MSSGSLTTSTKGRHRAPRPHSTRRVVTTASAAGAGLALPLLGVTAAHATGNHPASSGETSSPATYRHFDAHWQPLSPAEAPVLGGGQKTVQPAQQLSLSETGGAVKITPVGGSGQRSGTQPADSAAKQAVTVRHGDTLSSIAAEHHVPGGWQRLYEDNRSVLKTNPNALHPGTSLSVDPHGKPVTTPQQPQQTDRTTRAGAEEPATRDASSPGEYVRPVTGGTLSAGFDDSGNRWSHGHTGQDFAVQAGTSVKSVTDGTVVRAGWSGAYGYEVVVKHAAGVYTQYAHLSSITASPGSKISAGQQIARSGNTGNTTGPHLHFEVRGTPDYGSARAPLTWLRQHGVTV